MARFRISADIGGTFTDFVVEDKQSGTLFPGKVPSTPHNPAAAVFEGVRQLIANPADIDFIVHGQTVGLNAFLERKGARVLLITTAGVGDFYTIARGHRTELYTLRYRKPTLLIPPADVHEVRERIKWDGSVAEPLHQEDFEPIIRKVRDEKIQAVAVCFLHAYAYPDHELQAREILSQALPDVSITLSHETAREWREFERASTATMSAYVAPKVNTYLSQLQKDLRGIGVKPTLHIMQSNGGIMTVDNALKSPIQTLMSGPVGGTIGGAALSAVTGRPNLVCVDMGGTSFDMSLITDGRPSVTSETELEGLPLLVPIVQIHTIGAGGGSLAWIEAGGLRVGPQSAGAVPGPACYSRGGTQPTVTDANAFLGRLGANSLLSGRLTLDLDAATKAIHSIAVDLGLDDVTLAEGICSIINAKMADAIRTITIGQGIDPRSYALVAFGGAGPMHAVFLARELGMSEVIAPVTPGAFSAWGMLQADIRHDITRPFYHSVAELAPELAEDVCKELIHEGRSLLWEEEVRDEEMYFEVTADMRYVGQEYTVTVPLTLPLQLADVAQAFHETYRIRYGHATPDAPVEFVNIRVAALGRVPRSGVTAFQPPELGQDPLIGSRSVIYDGVSRETPVLKRERMAPGGEWSGPVIIEEQTATTVVPPDCDVRVDIFGNIIIKVGGAR